VEVLIRSDAVAVVIRRRTWVRVFETIAAAIVVAVCWDMSKW
jgi:hypothetical protein